MNKLEKTELAGSLKDKFNRAKVAVFADYKGLSANQANDLRKQIRAENGEIKVIKNNVARMLVKDGTVKGQGIELLDSLAGPTLVAFGYGDPAATAKIIHKFANTNEALKLKDCLMGDKRLNASAIEELAQLPPREVMLAKLLGTLNAPISNFVGVLAAVPRSFVQVLAAIEKTKE